MAVTINDREIDKKLDGVRKMIQKEFNIKKCTKSDTLRFLLKINKQGRRTDKKWKDIIG